MAREKDYEPTPVYNRKLVRSILKNKIEQKYGHHNVNETMSEVFRRARKGNK